MSRRRSSLLVAAFTFVLGWWTAWRFGGAFLKQFAGACGGLGR